MHHPCVQPIRTDGVQGFDEFMNLVIDEAEEVAYEKKTGKEEGRRKLGTSTCPTLRPF
jgi:hypothetical protein